MQSGSSKHNVHDKSNKTDPDEHRLNDKDPDEHTLTSWGPLGLLGLLGAFYKQRPGATKLRPG